MTNNNATPLSVEAQSTTPQPITSPELDAYANAVIRHPLPAPEISDTATPIDTLGVATTQWLFSLSWQPTAVPKAGWLNTLRKKTQLIDLDLSCILYDRDGKILERVWFKNVRDNAESVRHQGDSLDGTRYQDNQDKIPTSDALMPSSLSNTNIDQEKIEINLTKIPEKVHFLVFVVSSFYGQSLSNAVDGHCQLSDDEGNLISELNFNKLPRDCNAIWFATLSREFNTWHLINNQQALLTPQLAQFEQEIQHQLTVMFPSVPAVPSMSSIASPSMIIRPRA